jgi:ParB family chromosome partitioning protein
MALGKGLSALIPEKSQDPAQLSAFSQSQAEPVTNTELAVSLIQDNRLQPRQNYDEAKLDELVSSIKDNGFLQPIVVRKIEEGYEVIAGERRLKAARKLGLERVPVVVKAATDKEALVLALVENIQREELNPIEKADSYRRLVDEFEYSQEDVAKSVGKDRATISNLLRLLKLPEEIRKAIVDGKITEGHARALLSVEDPNAQMVLFLETLHKGFSVREVEERAKSSQNPSGKVGKKIKKTVTRDPEIVALEQELRQLFGTKVMIDNKRGNKGKLVIEYYSLNDFDRILEVVRK